MNRLSQFNVKIFADGADVKSMLALYKQPFIQGFTTNPTLMRKAGISDYKAFASEVLNHIQDKPISFEVFADTFDEMEEQACEIASWGENVYVKIPVTNTRGQSSGPLIRKLSATGIRVNVTAILSLNQVKEVVSYLSPMTPAIVSVFAGRVADTGVDPVPLMKKASACLKSHPNAQLLWASPRELLNIFQANDAGCHIISVTHDLLAKLALIGKDLNQFSLETVKMFYDDAQSAGYQILTLEEAV